MADRPYPLSVLLINGGNALFQALNHHRFAEALRSIPLVVSFDTFINETNEYADIILPTPTFLESWDEVSSVPSVVFTQVGIQQPIVAPFYESRSTADILIDLAGRLGEPVQSGFTYENYSDAIPHLQQATRNPHIRTRVLLLLGKTFRSKQMYDLAIKQLSDALADLHGMDNTKKEVLYEKGLVHLDMGDKESALDSFKQIYEVDYGYRDVAKRVEESYSH